MGFIDDLKDIFGIAYAVLSSPIIWGIIALAVYFIFQMYLMLIAPLTILILPAGLIIYLLWEDNRRMKSQYGMKKPVVETTKWDVSKSLDNYIKTLTKAQILDEDRKKDME